MGMYSYNLSGGDRMDTYLLALIRENQEELVNRWLGEIKSIGKEKSLRVVSDQLLINTSREFVDLIITNIEQPKEQISLSLNDFSERIIKQGFPLSYITEGLQRFRWVISKWLKDMDIDPSGQLRIMGEVNEWIDPIVNHMVNHYSGSRSGKASRSKVLTCWNSS